MTEGGWEAAAALARSFDGVPFDRLLVETPTVAAMLARAASEDLRQPALTYYERGRRWQSTSYEDLLRAVVGTRDRLRRSGLAPGDRVVLVSGNCAEVVIFDLAALSAGIVVVPLAPDESSARLGAVLADSQASLLVYGARTPNVAEAIQLGEVAQLSLREVTSAPAADARIEPAAWTSPVAPSSPAVLLYTSGTTGLPKGVTLSHYNLAVNAEGLVRVHGIDRPTTHMAVLPLHHTNAFSFSMVGCCYSRSHLVLNDAFHPMTTRRTLAAEKVAVCSVVPSVLAALAQRFCRLEDLPSFRYFVSAAAPLPLELARRFYETTGIPVHQGYGLSECTNFATTIPHDVTPELYDELMHRGPVPSVGSALFGCTVDVVDASGARLPTGTRGEVAIRGHNVMLGYWNDAEASRRALGEGFLRSGDEGFLVERDGGSYLHLTGRLKELIIRNGDNINPRQVESEIASVLGDKDFAVVGFDHDAVGEEVGLYLRAKSAAGVARALALVPHARRPKVVVLGTTAVPRTSTGKVKRAELKQLFGPFAGARVVAGRVMVTPEGSPDRITFVEAAPTQ
jgi:acyl-CoA synthetase (AMP-forming)/AMP-acid ligase II